MTNPLHLQVGVLMADHEAREFLAKQWGKESTKSDISLYTLSSDDLVQTTVVPIGYPKKPLPLIFSAHMADVVVLGTPISGIDKTVGEAAILADCLRIPGINSVIGEQTKGLDSYFDQIDKVFTKLDVKNWQKQMIYDGTTASEAREKLKTNYPGARGKPDDYLAIEVDHSFPVQGVGSVILGTVLSGTVQKGQKVKAYPGGQIGTIRSIQVNDIDEREAHAGVHVGIALKGLLPKYLERGTVIGSDDDIISEQTEIKLENFRSSVIGEPGSVGDRIHVVSGLYSAPGEIVEWGERPVVKLDKPVPFHKYIRFSLLDLNKNPVILGSHSY